MQLRRLLDSSPTSLRLGSERNEASYQLARDLVAIHGGKPSPTAVLAFEGENVAVEPLPDASERGLEQLAVGPVYRHVPGGGLAVPTGRAFVRFAEGDSPSRHEHELATAGYQLEQAPAYAPHAAWVRAASGSVVDALRHLDRLERLPAVESVEPQLLTQARRRN
jgi:hypothetical protein